MQHKSPLSSLFIFVFSATVIAKSTAVSQCVSDCLHSASAKARCNGLDADCLSASQVFKTEATECLQMNACSERSTAIISSRDSGDHLELLDFIEKMRADGEYDGMVPEGTVLKTRSSNHTQKRSCNSASGICVTGSSSDCKAYCKTCHTNSSGKCGVFCDSGICSGTFGLTCACQLDCFTC